MKLSSFRFAAISSSIFLGVEPLKKGSSSIVKLVLSAILQTPFPSTNTECHHSSNAVYPGLKNKSSALSRSSNVHTTKSTSACWRVP